MILMARPARDFGGQTGFDYKVQSKVCFVQFRKSATRRETCLPDGGVFLLMGLSQWGRILFWRFGQLPQEKELLSMSSFFFFFSQPPTLGDGGR
jgi:hypothetical protein